MKQEKLSLIGPEEEQRLNRLMMGFTPVVDSHKPRIIQSNEIR